MARLILDSGVLINAMRRKLELGSLIAHDDVALPAAVVTECLVGIGLDPDESRRLRQRTLLNRILDTTPVEDYTAKIVPHHVDLIMHTRQQGQPRGPHDLIIAATARATGRTLLTTDLGARFDGLPGVDTRVITD